MCVLKCQRTKIQCNTNVLAARTLLHDRLIDPEHDIQKSKHNAPAPTSSQHDGLLKKRGRACGVDVVAVS